MKTLTDQERAEAFKKALINKMNQNLLTVFKTMINEPAVKDSPIYGKGVSDAVNDLLLINSLMTMMTNHGRPVELVFISEKGDKINLLDEKPLSQNKLVDIFLDNLTNTNQHEGK